jgi:dolichol-phosphate mannosyltransferase
LKASSGSGERAELAIVIPAHNEATALERLVTEAAEAAEAASGSGAWEIVVVDDHSSDDSALVLSRLCAVLPQLRIARHERQFGQSQALVTGVRVATASWIVTLDGDGQNDPGDIGGIWRFARRAETDRAPVLVVGHRRVRHDNIGRKAVSWLLSRWSALVLRHPIVDQGCGTKCFRRETFLSLPAFDHMHRFLPGLFVALDAQILSYPVRHAPRLNGRSHYRNLKRIREALVDVAGILWLRRRLLGSDLD